LIRSKGKGKSGGARIITYLDQQTLYLLNIYDKADTKTIDYKIINELLKEIGN